MYHAIFCSDCFEEDDFADGLDMDALAGMLEEGQGVDSSTITVLPVDSSGTMGATAPADMSAAALGLELSSDEEDKIVCQNPKSAFGAAFGGALAKLTTKTHQDQITLSLGSPAPIEIKRISPSEDSIDPLEQELRSMEQKMAKIKSELAKKKFNQKNPVGTSRKCSKLTYCTEGRESTKVLTSEEKAQLLKRLKENKSSIVHSGETDSEDDEDNRNPLETKYNSYGHAVKKMLASNESSLYNNKYKSTSCDTSGKNQNLSGTNISLLKSLADKKAAVLNRLHQSPTGSWQGVQGSLMGLRDGAAVMTPAEQAAVKDPFSGIFIV